MRYSTFWGAVLAFSTGAVLRVVRADVYPDYPAGDLQTPGQTCNIKWKGDSGSDTMWKDMSIEFMTGDNSNMVHLTTVVTGQDGTVDGSYKWTCPEVTPNSAIYFYQFRTPHNTTAYEWTTRFAIASSSGKVTSPPNDKQPGGAAIPWGTGALADPSKAVPAPIFASTPTTTTSQSPTATKPPTTSSTPSNLAPNVVSGCTSFFTRPANFMCSDITANFGITIDNFNAWNGGSNACDVLQVGFAYCVAKS